MSGVFADTSYYVALLNPSDRWHDLAVELATELPSPVITTGWVLAELANALAAARQRRLFSTWYQDLRNDPEVVIIPPSEDLFAAGVESYIRHGDKDWSLTDCISFLVMKERGMRDALTADRHFEQAGFRALLR